MKNTDDLIVELTKNCKIQKFNDLFKSLKKRGLEAALSGELTEHLSYDKHARSTERAKAIAAMIVSVSESAL